MVTEKEVEDLLEQLAACSPKPFQNDIDMATKGEQFILFYLKRNLTTSPAAIAENMGVSKARISKLITRMENKGVIERSQDETDGRKQIIRITTKGEQEAERLKKQMLDSAAVVIDKVGLDNMKEFIRLSILIRDAFCCCNKERRQDDTLI